MRLFAGILPILKKKQADDYLAYIGSPESNKLFEINIHPCQLWSYNVGRIALLSKKTDVALSFFTKSISECLNEKSGPTIQIMALLPIAEMNSLGKMCGNEMKNAESIIRNAVKELNKQHFGKLFNKQHDCDSQQSMKGLAQNSKDLANFYTKDFEEIVSDVYTSPGNFFPFNYR